MKMFFLWDYYDPYLKSFIKKCYDNQVRYDEIMKDMKADYFSWVYSLSNAINANGVSSKFVVGNDKFAQRLWAKENGLKFDVGNEKLDIIMHQIKLFKPDILFFGIKKQYLGGFLEEIRLICKKIFCWVGSPINYELKNINLVFGNNPFLKDYFSNTKIGFKFFKPGFDQNILKLVNKKEKIKVSFIGQVSRTNHDERLEYLDYLALSYPPFQVFGMNYDTNLFIRRIKDIIIALRLKGLNISNLINISSSPYYSKIKNIRKRFVNEVWGIDMYNIIFSSLITFNKHVDNPQGVAGNMRMFEATGVGSCLITDHKNNNDEYFVPEKEIIVYKDKFDLMDKLNFYINNDKARQEIALAGQKRTLKDHTIDIRANELINIIEHM